jgi:hypothetical protein
MRLRIILLKTRDMTEQRVVTGAAVIGAIASVLAAGLLWLVVTRPAAVGMMLSVWLGAGN